MLVQQLGAALEPVSAAAEAVVGPAWREVPAYTLFFLALFLVALPFWVSRGSEGTWALSRTAAAALERARTACRRAFPVPTAPPPPPSPPARGCSATWWAWTGGARACWPPAPCRPCTARCPRWAATSSSSSGAASRRGAGGGLARAALHPRTA